ncbi:MAG: hypothetical protein QXE00_02790 [Candidatus Bathyarchaeia archaeon]
MEGRDDVMFEFEWALKLVWLNRRHVADNAAIILDTATAKFWTA